MNNEVAICHFIICLNIDCALMKNHGRKRTKFALINELCFVAMVGSKSFSRKVIQKQVEKVWKAMLETLKHTHILEEYEYQH